jgi:hypothetical protein
LAPLVSLKHFLYARLILKKSNTTATGIGLLVQTAKPGAVFGQANVINFGTPFWSLSVATNVLSTILIAGRLLYRRRMLRDTTGGYGATQLRMYTSTVAIFAESAALYAICAIVYIPMFVKNIPLQYPFSSLLGSMSVCSEPYFPNWDIS